MGRYCYCATVKDFMKENRATWLSKMQTQFDINSVMPLGQSQINAWGDCFNVLQVTLPDFEKTIVDSRFYSSISFHMNPEDVLM